MKLAKYQPCGCVVCTCEDPDRCHGCGAKNCGTHPVGEMPNPVYEAPSAFDAWWREEGSAWRPCPARTRSSTRAGSLKSLGRMASISVAWLAKSSSKLMRRWRTGCFFGKKFAAINPAEQWRTVEPSKQRLGLSSSNSTPPPNNDP